MPKKNKDYRIRRLGRTAAPFHEELPSGADIRLPGVHGVSVYELAEEDAEYLAGFEGLDVRPARSAVPTVPKPKKVRKTSPKKKGPKSSK